MIFRLISIKNKLASMPVSRKRALPARRSSPAAVSSPSSSKDKSPLGSPEKKAQCPEGTFPQSKSI